MSSFLDYNVSDIELAMPNGQTVYVVEGELPICYDIQRPDRSVGERYPWADWYLDGHAHLDVVDDDGREIRLRLPNQHPAVNALLDRIAESINDACVANGAY